MALCRRILSFPNVRGGSQANFCRISFPFCTPSAMKNTRFIREGCHFLIFLRFCFRPHVGAFLGSFLILSVVSWRSFGDLLGFLARSWRPFGGVLGTLGVLLAPLLGTLGRMISPDAPKTAEKGPQRVQKGSKRQPQNGSGRFQEPPKSNFQFKIPPRQISLGKTSYVKLKYVK